MGGVNSLAPRADEALENHEYNAFHRIDITREDHGRAHFRLYLEAYTEGGGGGG